MNGNPEVIAMLNLRLSEEHAAVVQYTVHAALCENWGYKKLSEYLYERAESEQEHAKELMERIIFLGGFAKFGEIAEVHYGATIPEMFEMDYNAEVNAVANYTEGIEIAVANKDFTTRALLEHILGEEESHLNVIEENITQITNSGIENYLIVKI